jgi:hypothetical protein
MMKFHRSTCLQLHVHQHALAIPFQHAPGRERPLGRSCQVYVAPPALKNTSYQEKHSSDKVSRVPLETNPKPWHQQQDAEQEQVQDIHGLLCGELRFTSEQLLRNLVGVWQAGALRFRCSSSCRSGLAAPRAAMRIQARAPSGLLPEPLAGHVAALSALIAVAGRTSSGAPRPAGTIALGIRAAVPARCPPWRHEGVCRMLALAQWHAASPQHCHCNQMRAGSSCL